MAKTPSRSCFGRHDEYTKTNLFPEYTAQVSDAGQQLKGGYQHG